MQFRARSECLGEFFGVFVRGEEGRGEFLLRKSWVQGIGGVGGVLLGDVSG